MDGSISRKFWREYQFSTGYWIFGVPVKIGK